MVSRLLIAGILVQAACVTIALPQSRSIQGTYRNAALGYSVRTPRGLKGVTGDEDGPERGVRISLPSGGQIAVFGEPNSLEWKTPEEGVRAELTCKRDKFGKPEIKPVRVGRVKGAKGSLTCDENILKLLLAFRTPGGPIYWFRLETTLANVSKDEPILEEIAASLRLIRWE